ncbi:MAG: alanine--tRNA ligase [Ignavibacteria bacterium]|nr:alanine--tRNA ligase [Ignavibacteria bacterium]
MNSKEVRNSFINFFREKEHKVVPSSPVVPYNDPTLLFTNAGMNQFKDVFLGTGTRDYTRAVDSQKCIRAGGKHNDLEEVGMDGYHHTFFEMLGNWSFGDYYKKEAITWAWELLTFVWKLPKEKLWVTVFETDEEAFEIWKNETDIDPKHILRFGEKDNFWEMGDTGPCGPCSEINYDFTIEGCKAEDINSGNEDVIEIWNLVFIQYNRKKDGELEPLPKKHVDTGMGFERVVRVLQDKNSNYETDLFTPLINKITELTGKKYEGENISSVNAIADHIRALTFAISDGAIPSNEGRGYVLRRILRRASRLARKLDFHKPILFQLVDTVVENFGEAYPEIIEKKDFTKEVIKAEEESFQITLDKGIKLFNEVAGSLKGTKIFPGLDAFKLYDTFGFPLDLTEVMAKEQGLKVDLLKFEEEMSKQKDRGRDARKDKLNLEMGVEIFDFLNENLSNQVKYNPYDVTDEPDEQEKNIAVGKTEEGKYIAVIDENPFYSESGGQINDTGKIILEDSKEVSITDSQKYFLVLSDDKHSLESIIQGNDLYPVKGKVVLDIPRRRSIERNHSATHLVHEALRRVLGSHVKQLGSLVHNEYLRFDFPHFHKVTDIEIKEIENMVNSKIRERIEVHTDADISIEEANKIPNVKKFFGEKYGDKVRVVHIDDKFSIEFCGGTHVKNTDDIGLFKIIKEESIASGTRRIFARTGEGITAYLNERISDIEKIMNELPGKYSTDFVAAINSISYDISKADFRNAEMMKKLMLAQDGTLASLYESREIYLEEKKQTERELLKQSLSKIFGKLDEIIFRSNKENGFDVIAARMDLNSMEEFKEIGDELRKKVNNGVALIAAVLNGKINLVCAVSDNLIKDRSLNAGKIVSEAAKELGGGGGGKPHLATAGAKDIVKLDEVLGPIA